MELQTAIKARRSIRSFLNKEVTDVQIRELIQQSLWAPSWGNTQPWQLKIIKGETLKLLKKESVAALEAGTPIQPEIPNTNEWPGILKTRYKEIGNTMYASLAIEKGNHEQQMAFLKNLFSFFDAPTMLLMTVHDSIALEYAMLDCGLFLQTFCLSAAEKGLGTCIMAVSVYYPEILRRLCKIDNSQRIVIGVALGWPDQEHPVNNFKRQRGEIDEFASWIS